MEQVKAMGGKNLGDLDPAFEALQRGPVPMATREGGWGLGHTALPTQLSPEPPSGVANHTGEEGKPGPGKPFDLEETEMVTPRTRAHSARGTPSQDRSGVQKLAAGFVCRARAPTVFKESQRPPARSAAPRAASAVPPPPPRAPGDGERLQQRELPVAATSLCSPARKTGSAAGSARKRPRVNKKNEDSGVSFVGTANAVMYACTRMAEWLRRWT